MPRQLMLNEILVNPSVEPEDELRLSRQAMRIYKMFRFFGKVSNVMMADVAKQYNARIYEIRKALEPFGRTVKLVEKHPNGLNFYKIANLEN